MRIYAKKRIKEEVYLKEFENFGNKTLDFARRIGINEIDEGVFKFGKQKGVLVTDVFKKEPGYYS